MGISYQDIGHIELSETRGYMALIMGASMAVVMSLFMRGMYANRGIIYETVRLIGELD